MLRSQVGKVIWRAEALIHKYHLFIRTIEERVRELEFHNFTMHDHTNFVAVMSQEVKMMRDGTPSFSKKPATLQYLSFSLKFHIVSLQDEWPFRVESRMRTIGVSTSALPRFLWEGCSGE